MTEPTHILGVDPGLSGAFCLLYAPTRQIVQIWDMPVRDGRVDPEGVALIVDLAISSKWEERQIHAAVENVSSMPRQAGAFDFGRSAGVVHGVLGALGVPFSLAQPNQWKSSFALRKGVGESQASTKTRARELAIKLWPEHATYFKRVKDDGRAESALIARFWASRTCILGSSRV